MSDDTFAYLFGLAMEFWAREEPIPEDIRRRLDSAAEDQRRKVVDAIFAEAER